MREELGYSDNDFVIGHVGRFSEPKNHMFLLDVFAEVHKKDDKYKLLLVGDGELRPQIEQKIKSLGLDDFIQLTGMKSNVNRLMMAMDLFMFPSKWEGLPVSVVEAQASGLPCVISNTITDEVCVTELVTRISLDANDDEWADLVVKQKDKARKNTFKQIVEAGYDVKSTSRRMQEFYLKLNDSNDGRVTV